MEMYSSESPYSFSGNNPVNNVDPSGMSYASSAGCTGGRYGYWSRGEYYSCGGGGENATNSRGQYGTYASQADYDTWNNDNRYLE